MTSYRTRQCDTITVLQETTFAWRLGVKNAPEKSRWIVIGFQTGKSGDQTQNPAIFDHVNLKNMYVMLNLPDTQQSTIIFHLLTNSSVELTVMHLYLE